ncbi:MAG: TrkA family potassium uptake protein [Bacteroidales bacterium]|nr:TrkA family potassium uptake protein [Bacteroidales bacterium]MBQ8645086.1 TrkA family potassium uptake protein [Bacteroidales bacterium]
MRMKYLVIGLGNFGSTLAATLTDMGHSVIGVDNNEHCIEEIKDRIDLAYIMDATERASLRSLPLDEIDCVIVAIGQSMDNSLRAVASLKELNVTNIIARALDTTHSSILRAMDINKILIPESYAARIFAEKILSNESEELL